MHTPTKEEEVFHMMKKLLALLLTLTLVLSLSVSLSFADEAHL